uniref:Uncharacterized protein n=1 Tax=Setaria italica TaxID=4555 RepID=K4A291_SETIT
MAYSPIISSLPSNYSSDEDGSLVEDGGPPYDDSNPLSEPYIVPKSPRYSYDKETEYEKEEEDDNETYIEENPDEEDEEAVSEAALAEVVAEERAKMWAAKKRKGEERAKKRREEQEVDSEMAKKRRWVDFNFNAGPMTPAIVGPAAPTIAGPDLESSGNSSEVSS